MKVMCIFSQFYIKGGMERIFLDRMNSLAEDYGYEVHGVACFQREDMKNAYRTSEKIHFHKLGFGYLSFSWLKPWKYFIDRRAMWKKLQAQVDAVNPDILLFSTYSSRCLCGLRFPNNTRIIIESHITRAMTWTLTSTLARFTREKSLRKMIRHADCIVALTESDAKNWPAEKTVIIPNFTNVQPVAPYEQTQNKKVVALGRYHYQKGFDLLLKAWEEVASRHPDWHLEIYGAGDPSKLNLPVSNSASATFNSQFSIFNSEVSLNPATHNVAETLSTASIFVMPSRYEGFGLVLLEAMTCGIPSVVFDCPDGPAEIIGDSGCGILVPPGDIHQFADRICYLIEHPDVRQRMSAAAISRSHAFSRTTIMNQWDQLFHDLLNS